MNKSSLGSVIDKKDNRKILIIMAILISVIVVNNVFYTILLDYELVNELSSSWGIMLFATLAAATYGIGWYILSEFVKRIDAEIGGKSRYFNWMYNAVRILFYVSAATIALAIFQMALTSHYDVILSVVAMASGFTLEAIILAILGYRFFSWFRSKRDIALFFYGLALVTAALGAAMIGFANTVIFLTGEPLQVAPSSSDPTTVEESGKAKNSAASELFQITLIPFRLAFGLYWIATVLLLHNYSKSFGRFKFWTIVSLPVLLFIAGSFFYSAGNYIHNLTFDVITSLTAPLVASLYAAMFLVIAKSIRQRARGGSGTLVYYLTISGYGIMVLIATASSPVHFVDYEQTPYPPFAVAPWSFGGLAAYLFSIGFYFSAICISQDVELRKSIRQIATREAKLIDDIGTAQMKQGILQRVAQMTKEQKEVLHRQTGIEQSLSKDEIKQYFDEAVEEIRKLRREQKK